MPRVDVPVNQATRTGTAMSAAVVGDAVENHIMVNDGVTGIEVTNTGATVARVVTFHLYRTVDGQAVTPRAESIAIGETQLFGPFPVADYGSSLMIDVDNAELTLRALRI